MADPASRKRRGGGRRPFVYLNLAMSADGKIANATQTITSFGSDQDRKQLLRLRAQADAVMAGARTLESPANTLRFWSTSPGSFPDQKISKPPNLRVVVSGRGSVDPNAPVFRHREGPIVLLTTEKIPSARLRLFKSRVDEIRICGRERIDFGETLEWLRNRWQVQGLLCEGGGDLNSALFEEDLVDQVNLTICPLVLGGYSAPTLCDGNGAVTLSQGVRLRLVSQKRFGHEQLLVYQVIKRHHTISA